MRLRFFFFFLLLTIIYQVYIYIFIYVTLMMLMVCYSLFTQLLLLFINNHHFDANTFIKNTLLLLYCFIIIVTWYFLRNFYEFVYCTYKFLLRKENTNQRAREKANPWKYNIFLFGVFGTKEILVNFFFKKELPRFIFKLKIVQNVIVHDSS